MLESGSSGSVRGVLSNEHPYREPGSITSFWGDADDFRSTPMNGHLQSRSACLKSANKRHQGSITLLAIAASAGELIFTARYEYLETVKHSLAYWTLKVPIGTAAAKRLLDGTSNGSRIEPAYPKRPARPMEALKGLALLSRGRAVNETRRTEIPSSSGMGSLASNSAY